jgi:hypothetical protein
MHPDELDQALRLVTTLTWQALTAADATLLSLAAGAIEHGAFPSPTPHTTAI